MEFLGVGFALMLGLSLLAVSIVGFFSAFEVAGAVRKEPGYEVRGRVAWGLLLSSVVAVAVLVAFRSLVQPKAGLAGDVTDWVSGILFAAGAAMALRSEAAISVTARRPPARAARWVLALGWVVAVGGTIVAALTLAGMAGVPMPAKSDLTPVGVAGVLAEAAVYAWGLLGWYSARRGAVPSTGGGDEGDASGMSG